MNKPSYAIIFDLRDVLLDYNPEHRNTAFMFRVIPQGLKLLKKCAAPIDRHGKSRHTLYALSNASPESYHNFITHHADLFHHFDGIVTSSISGFSKPDARAFYYIMDQYKLTPENCIFIDDKEVNVRVARAVGMHAIVCDDHERVIRELKKLNVF